MKINGTAAKHIKKYCYIVGLLSFLLAFFVCSQMIRYQEKEKKAVGTYMAQRTIRRVKEKLDNYITISDLLGNYIIDGSDMDENTFSCLLYTSFPLLIQLNNRMIWVFRILLSIQLYADLSSWKVHGPASIIPESCS